MLKLVGKRMKYETEIPTDSKYFLTRYILNTKGKTVLDMDKNDSHHLNQVIKINITSHRMK